jgi:hypothetical protein
MIRQYPLDKIMISTHTKDFFVNKKVTLLRQISKFFFKKRKKITRFQQEEVSAGSHNIKVFVIK